MIETFRQDVFIPFDLADPAGILFFGHVFALAHRTFERFIVDGLELSWENWFQNTEWIVPIKIANAHYQVPLQAGLNYTSEIFIFPLQRTSFKVQCRFWRGAALCCTVETVHVFCDRQQRKIDIPSDIRAKLDSFVAATALN